MATSFVETTARLDHDPFLLGVDLEFIGASKEYVNFWWVLFESGQRSCCNYGYTADRCKHIFCRSQRQNCTCKQSFRLLPVDLFPNPSQREGDTGCNPGVGERQASDEDLVKVSRCCELYKKFEVPSRRCTHCYLSLSP